MKQVTQIAFPLRKGKSVYTVKDIQELAKKQLSKYTGKGYSAMIGIKPNEGKKQWLNAEQFKVDNISTYGIPSHKQYDSDKLIWTTSNDFVIYVWGGNKAEGGNDIKNDCLFHCIGEAINYSEIPEGFHPAYRFKRRLKLERDDKVPMSKLAFLEDRFKINFNVTGDKTFISTNKYQKTVNLKLINEHYTLVHNNKKTKVLMNGYQFKEQELIIFENQDDNYITYDGCNKKVISNEEFESMDKFTHIYKLNDSETPIIDYYDEVMMKVYLIERKN